MNRLNERKVIPITIHEPLKQPARLSFPAWPLQSTVAVNPFWNQIDRPFDEVMAKTSQFIHRSMYMPLSYYLERYRSGWVTDADLLAELKSVAADRRTKRKDLQEFIQECTNERAIFQEYASFSDYLDKQNKTSWSKLIQFEISKYAAAYFDESQALAKFPWRHLNFYQAWFAAQEFDRSMKQSGVRGFSDSISEFKDLEAEAAIQMMAKQLGISDNDVLSAYLSRLSIQTLGWSSQFRYHEWQKTLGYSSKAEVHSLDLIAIRMLMDFALAKDSERDSAGVLKDWLSAFSAQVLESQGNEVGFEVHRIWQGALERHYQRSVAKQIVAAKHPSASPRFQVVMCIDVRSEVYRRALEAESKEIETIGFAGFFGAPFDFRRIDEKAEGHRLPVLLASAFTVHEEMKSNKSSSSRIVQTLTNSYFRNLRKAPLSSFLYVELYGLLALSEMMGRLRDSVWPKARASKLPKRFSDQGRRPSRDKIQRGDGASFLLADKIERAAGILGHLGLRERFAKMVVIAGHGSANTNNAFSSALDCGACGGHAGDINARFVADLLNDPEVRRGLKEKNLNIPESTVFVGAVHETVTDELYLLDQELVSPAHQADLDTLSVLIQGASQVARIERQNARSTNLDVSAGRRSANWAEVRPEWALAGNACFVVAPRSFSVSANFNGRSFLHDYDWKKDEGFATLELIMTAPMLVTNWINMQYYSSTVAPQTYGSGNKVLHNLINEFGVVEGNGGELRVGLPWQSIHDGAKFVHEPLRLSVFIAAPIPEIEAIISKHPTVAHLIDNAWVHLIHIDSETGKCSKRKSAGNYEGL